MASVLLTGAAGGQTATPPRAMSLRETLELAARQSPDVASARAQAQLAAATASRAASAWQPELVATGSYDHTSAPATLNLGQFVNLVGAVYQISPQNLGVIPDPLPIVGVNSKYAAVQLSQPLFSPQGLFLLGPAAAGAEAARLGADEAREQVLLAVARTYLALGGISQLLVAAQDAEAVARARERDARNRLSAGVEVEVAVLRARTETAQAQSQMAQLRAQRESLLSFLEALVGAPVEPVAGPSQSLFTTSSSEADSPWENTYAVRSAHKQLDSLQGTVEYDELSWLPSLVGIARGNYNSNTGFTGKTLSYDLILALNFPLYDRGLRYAALREDEAKLAQARAMLASARAKAKSAWLTARANVEAARAVLALSQAQVELAARMQKQIEAAWKAGVSTSLEMSDADNKKFAAASAAAQANAALEIRRSELAAAEGRLYQRVP